MSPFNTLVAKPKRGVPRVYINLSKPGAAGGILGWFLGMGRSIKFDEPKDLILLADCDKTVRDICDRVGWSEEIDKIKVKVLEEE